jgi:KAP family P-loop domain
VFWESFDRSLADDSESTPFRILADAPVTSRKQDRLNFGAYADALAVLIGSKATSTPLIAAISAPWGAGKSTVAGLVREYLQAPNSEWGQRHIVCCFNAWQHDDAPYLGPALASEVAQCASCNRYWWRRVIQPLPSSMLTPEQRWRRKVAVIVVSAAAAIGLVLGRQSRDFITALAQPTDAHWLAAEHATHGIGLTLFVVFAAVGFIVPRILSGSRAVARFLNDPQSVAARGSMNAVRAQLGQIIHAATRNDRRLIIFVDDLERCRPPRAVEICEVVSQLLNLRDVVTVLVGDMESIALSAALKYRSLEVPDSLAADQAANVDYAQYGRAYLQKLVQLQLELPPARPDLLRKMLYDDLADAQSASSGGPEKSQKVVVRFGVGLVAVAASILSLGYALPPELLAGAVGVGGVGAGFASRFFEQRQERRAQKLAGEDRQKIDDAIGGVDAGITVYEAIDKVTQETGLNASKVRDRVFSEVMAGIVAPVDKWVYGVMPNRPRAAKRLLNQVHLMISVAIGRGLFLVRDIENNKRRVNRVCKWLIICERWPAVARLAQSDIRKISVLEKATTSERLTKILKENNVTHVDDINDLYKLLQHSPKFGAIDDLVFLAGLPGEAFVPDGWPVTGNSAKSAKKPSVLWQRRSSRSVKN